MMHSVYIKMIDNQGNKPTFVTCNRNCRLEINKQVSGMFSEPSLHFHRYICPEAHSKVRFPML